ncbi:MAG: hypothetical protein IPO08_19875 [Xanthomonadales bacterium]|nr:hypothetical protein [Xanthomonadales bacterium]
MVRTGINGYIARRKADRSLAYEAAILPLLQDIPSHAVFMGEYAEQSADDMFEIAKALGAEVIISEDGDD